MKPVSEEAKKPGANTMWGGRFSSSPSALMEAINASIDFDKRLASQDIQGSIAHSAMLAKQGIISQADRDAIHQGLQRVLGEIETGNFTYSKALEDIHMNVESRLREIVGDPAARLHTARSRNDQVATDTRLWVREAHDRTDEQLTRLIGALLGKAEAHAGTVMPGFTHLQSAQPVTFGHHLMAYVEMFARDRGRIRDSRTRLNESPLGAAALAGTSFPVDREATARALGFDRPARWTTGSSIMPQKRNPDAAELVRGKAGRIFGALIAVLTVMKGLPLAYSKDLQEDKEQLFDAADTLEIVLAATTGMIQDLEPVPGRMAAVAGAGFSTATDLADWLVRSLNIPFRDAHHVTGRIVSEAEKRGATLEDLPLDVMQAVEPRIHQGIYVVLGVENSVRSRMSFGGTSPVRVAEQIAWWRERV